MAGEQVCPQDGSITCINVETNILYFLVKIQLQFIKFALAVPNDCDSNFLDIFPESTDIPSRINSFCGMC